MKLWKFGNTFGNGNSGRVEQCPSSVSVMLVGNKIDQAEDRMVTHEEGERRSRELGCDQLREISVREQVDVPRNVVEQLYTHWKHGHHAVKFTVQQMPTSIHLKFKWIKSNHFAFDFEIIQRISPSVLWKYLINCVFSVISCALEWKLKSYELPWKPSISNLACCIDVVRYLNRWILRLSRQHRLKLLTHFIWSKHPSCWVGHHPSSHDIRSTKLAN